MINWDMLYNEKTNTYILCVSGVFFVTKKMQTHFFKSVLCK